MLDSIVLFRPCLSASEGRAGQGVALSQLDGIPVRVLDPGDEILTSGTNRLGLAGKGRALRLQRLAQLVKFRDHDSHVTGPVG